MFGGHQRSYGHDAELFNHHVGRLLVPVSRLGWETVQVNEHVERFVVVGSSGLLDCRLIEIIELEDLGTCFLKLGRMSIVHHDEESSTDMLV
jgi:flavin reductase (DIM6/NTAB) family NADH-FMN oxidoreductase RutF